MIGLQLTIFIFKLSIDYPYCNLLLLYNPFILIVFFIDYPYFTLLPLFQFLLYLLLLYFPFTFLHFSIDYPYYHPFFCYPYPFYTIPYFYTIALLLWFVSVFFDPHVLFVDILPTVLHAVRGGVRSGHRPPLRHGRRQPEVRHGPLDNPHRDDGVPPRREHPAHKPPYRRL